MKLFLHSRQQQHRYSCVSDNSCVAGLAAANAHAHSAPAHSVAAPGPLVKLRQAAPGLQCALLLCWEAVLRCTIHPGVTVARGGGEGGYQPHMHMVLT